MRYSDKMYSLAFEFLERRPFYYMLDDMMFAFRSRKTGQEVYCCILGNLGDYYALSAYIGNEGLQSYYMVAEGDISETGICDPDTEYAIHSQNCVQCVYWDSENPDTQDGVLDEQIEGVLAYVERTQTNYFEYFTPFFLDILPFACQSTLTDPDRIAMMEEAMEVCLGTCAK